MIGVKALAYELPETLGVSLCLLHVMPSDFGRLDEVTDGFLAFQAPGEVIATPFEWKFARCDVALVLGEGSRAKRSGGRCRIYPIRGRTYIHRH
jgi:hypothetical protein